MAKRAKKEAVAVTSSELTQAALRSDARIAALHTHTGECFDDPGPGHGSPSLVCDQPTPTIEERLRALEAQLTESQALVNKQAAVIVMGAENAERLRASRARGKKLEVRMNDSKKQAKTDKQGYEAWVEEHFALEEELSSGQQRLPFPAPEPEPTKPEATGTATAVAADDPPDESWRLALLDTLGGIPKSTVAKLYEANICTFGDLIDYQQPSPTGYVKRLTDIPGIGEASADKILDALAEFWATWAKDQTRALESATLAAVEETEEERDAYDDSDDYDPDHGTDDEDAGDPADDQDD